jgi:hypothetical protein
MIFMKKFGKFVFATLSLVAMAGGIFYFVKNVINKDSNDDFDDFEDDFDEFEDDFDEFNDEEETTEEIKPREYVSLNTTEPELSEEIIENPEDFVSDETVSEE